MTTLSGWCTAPAGLRPHHEACRWPLCRCSCHTHTTHDNRAEGRGEEAPDA